MGNWADHPHIDPELIKMNPNFKKYNDKSLELHKRLAVTWAADVYSAIKNKNNLHILFYEDIILKSGEPFSNVLQDWGLYSCFLRLKDILNESSSTSHEWSDHSSTSAKLYSWKSRLSPEIIGDVLEVIKDLDVNLYDCNSLPVEFFD